MLKREMVKQGILLGRNAADKSYLGPIGPWDKLWLQKSALQSQYRFGELNAESEKIFQIPNLVAGVNFLNKYRLGHCGSD